MVGQRYFAGPRDCGPEVHHGTKGWWAKSISLDYGQPVLKDLPYNKLLQDVTPLKKKVHAGHINGVAQVSGDT